MGRPGPRQSRTGRDVPYYVTLSPQSALLGFEGNGTLLAGSLPFYSRARFRKWNAPVTEGVEWSLHNPPAGVGIDPDGLVTVAADAALEDENVIAVRAAYDGGVYTAALAVNKDTRSAAPRYLGTVQALPAQASVTIVKGPAAGQVRARQGDYVLAVASGVSWQAGRVYQWSGAAWEYRPPANYTDLYIRCFKDGLDVPSLTYDAGWFGSLFARLIVAQQAFIEELETKVLKISGAVYGGGRFNAQGGVADQNKPGWFLGGDGVLKAIGAQFNGTANGTFKGAVYADKGEFDNVIIKGGTITSGPLYSANETQTPVGLRYRQVLPFQPHGLL